MRILCILSKPVLMCDYVCYSPHLVWHGWPLTQSSRKWDRWSFAPLLPEACWLLSKSMRAGLAHCKMCSHHLETQEGRTYTHTLTHRGRQTDMESPDPWKSWRLSEVWVPLLLLLQLQLEHDQEERPHEYKLSIISALRRPFYIKSEHDQDFFINTFWLC